MQDPVTERDRRFLAWANAGALLFSTCDQRQYMAISVDRRFRVNGTGYNGSAPGMPHCEEGACPRREAVLLGIDPGPVGKDCIAIHAEVNCVAHSGLDRYCLYVNGVPCPACARVLSSAGYARVIGQPRGSMEYLWETRAILEAGGAEFWLDLA